MKEPKLFEYDKSRIKICEIESSSCLLRDLNNTNISYPLYHARCIGIDCEDCVYNKHNTTERAASKLLFNPPHMKISTEKYIKINVPEGYEIDKEKSTFEKIVFKEISLGTFDICNAVKHTVASINPKMVLIELLWLMSEYYNDGWSRAEGEKGYFIGIDNLGEPKIYCHETVFYCIPYVKSKKIAEKILKLLLDYYGTYRFVELYKAKYGS
jgi:hypothetical protein